jgi:hypothetical protein
MFCELADTLHLSDLSSDAIISSYCHGKTFTESICHGGGMYFCTLRKNFVAALPKVLPKRPFALRFFAAFYRNALALTAANVSA